MKCRLLTFLLASASLALSQDELVVKSQLAKQAMIERQFDQAERLYSELSKALPDNAGLLMNLGLAQHSAGRYRKAIASFGAAMKLEPGLTEAKFLTGVAYLKLGQPTQAIGPLTAAITAAPGHRMARLELADALLSTGRFEEAAFHFRELTSLDPKDPRAWQGLGLSYLGSAREAFEALQKSAPDSAYALALLANSQAQAGQLRSSFALYRQALQKDSKLRGVHATLAEIYRNSGHPEWSGIEEQRERELTAPDCAAASAECAFAAGRYEQALATTRAPRALYWNSRSYGGLAHAAFGLLAQLPPSSQIHELMTEAFTKQGQHHEAAGELRQALLLDPANQRLEALLATALWRSRDFDNALPLLMRLVAEDPNSASLNFETGDTLLQQEDADKALPWLQAAVKINSGLLPAQASLGRAYMRTGNPSEAIPHLKAALPIDEDGSLHFQLARAYDRSGNPTLAKEAQQQFDAMARDRAKARMLENEQAITAP